MVYRTKKGFTLAEVLITLGVIGVVSAMTLPTVINQYRQKVTITKAKKFYSVINQAILMSIKDNGSINEWNVPDGHNEAGAKAISNYLKPYLKISKDCGSKGCYGYENEIKNLYGVSVPYGGSSYYKLILQDGSYIWWRNTTQYCRTTDYFSNVCFIVWSDINGSKKPNIIGIDIFAVYVTAENKVALMPSSKCSNGYSYGCLAYIIEHNNMDYLKDVKISY